MKRCLCLFSISTGLLFGMGCEMHPLPQAKDKAKEPVEHTAPAEPTPEASPVPQFFPDR